MLLVDEVLAVGDEGFTHKCLDKFAEFKRRGKTILLVTHSLGLVERFCDEALWLDAGRIKGSGDPKRIVGAYITDVERREERGAGGRPTRRAKESASAAIVSPDEPASAVLPDNPIETATRPRGHVPRGRRALGIARGRDHRRHARRAPTARPATSSIPASVST